jgi:tRNA A-37 threonylcarbamoyl transferase component Bud32/tetratricopeptide (TPR) repeat protein
MPADDCPDENALNAFVEHLLPRETRAVVAAHLDGCRECLEIVSVLAASSPVTTGETAANDADAEGDAAGEGPRVAAGSRMGRYTIVAMIGQGGMGNVYLAHDPQLDRRVALKLLRRERLSPGMRRRMANEARLMARLVHPSIVTVFEAGDEDGQMYIAMELVEGETLASWLAREVRLREEILGVFLVAGRALAVSHAAGVVHRDFKPDNVLLGAGGRVAVSDFGIAADTDHVEGAGASGGEVIADSRGQTTTRRRLTGEGDWLGTPAYMSPEQYLGEKVGPASDQFSFAVAVYEALHREHPFVGATFAERRESVLSGKRRVLSPAARRRVPAALRRVLDRALARRAEDRYPSMTALLDALEARRARHAWTSRAAVAAMVLALVTGAGVLATRATLGHPSALSAPRAGASEVSSSATSSPPHGPAATSAARTAVFVLEMNNRSGDARLDGVVESCLVTLLGVSPHLDAYLAPDLRTQARQVDPGASGDDDTLGRELQARQHRPVVLTQGELVLDGGNVVVSLTARDIASGRVVAELRQPVPSRDDVTGPVRDLASRLRAALGDAPAADEGPPPRLSSSLAALHDWAAGRMLLGTGHPEAALVPLGRATKEDPSFAEAHAALGVAEYDDQDGPAAAAQYDLALRDAAAFGRRRRLQLLASFYAAEDRPSESIGASEELLSAWPGDLPSELMVTATALGSREFSLGLEFARRAMNDHPEASMARQNLVVALLAHGDLAEAAAQGEAYLAAVREPQSYLFATVAVTAALQGDRERALATYAKLAAVDPEFADEGRADLAMYDGRFAEAEALLRPLIAAAVASGEPANARTEYRSLARCRLHAGDRAGARAAARAALGGGGVVLQYALASTLVESGSEVEATRLAAAWSDKPSVLWRAYAKLLTGDILLHRGKGAEAAESYAAARSLHDEWRMHERLGEAYLLQGDLARARTELQLCADRRSEGAVLETPSLQYVSEAAAALARVKQGLAATPSPSGAMPADAGR